MEETVYDITLDKTLLENSFNRLEIGNDELGDVAAVMDEVDHAYAVNVEDLTAHEENLDNDQPSFHLRFDDIDEEDSDGDAAFKAPKTVGKKTVKTPRKPYVQTAWGEMDWEQKVVAIIHFKKTGAYPPGIMTSVSRRDFKKKTCEQYELRNDVLHKRKGVDITG